MQGISNRNSKNISNGETHRYVEEDSFTESNMNRSGDVRKSHEPLEGMALMRGSTELFKQSQVNFKTSDDKQKLRKDQSKKVQNARSRSNMRHKMEISSSESPMGSNSINRLVPMSTTNRNMNQPLLITTPRNVSGIHN